MGRPSALDSRRRRLTPLTSASRLEKLLVCKELQIHLSDRVLVIPMQSIKFMEYTPASDDAPDSRALAKGAGADAFVTKSGDIHAQLKASFRQLFSAHYEPCPVQ